MPHHHSQTIDINAAPAQVWSVMTDVERWPEWTASVSRVVLLTPGPLRGGSRVRIKQPGFPPAWWRVTEWEANRGFTWVSRAPCVRVTGRHWIEPADAASRVTLAICYEGLLGPLIARWTRTVNDRYLKMEAEGLKARCLAIAAS